MLGKHALLLSFFAFASVSAFAQTPAAAPSGNATPPAKEHRVFDITRDGNKIGAEDVTIERDGDTTVIKFKTHISVVVMFVEAYRFDHSAVETWTGGKFVSYKALTDDNGKKHSVIAVAKDDKIDLTADGTRSEAPGDAVFASLWSRDFVDHTTLLHPDTGAALSVKVKDLGEETITQRGAEIKAHHYKITGDLERDVWFDGDTLVRIKFFGSDHSTIASELTSP